MERSYTEALLYYKVIICNTLDVLVIDNILLLTNNVLLLVIKCVTINNE